MRFRAKIQNVGLFIRLVTAVQKISNNAVFHLSPKQVQLIVVNDVTDGFQVWSGMSQASLCSEYLIESLNNGIISLYIDLDKLLKALKSGQSAHEISMKLTKKPGPGGAFLSFAIEVHQAQSITVIQDVPVQVMTQQQFSTLVEPQLPDPDLYIMLPPSKQLRPIVEHMKNVDGYLYVIANMKGELTLRIENEMFTIGSFFRNLEHPKFTYNGVTSESLSPDTVATVKVDIKKFYKSLYSYQVASANIVCCFFEKQALVLHVMVEDLFVTYYIPVVDQSND